MRRTKILATMGPACNDLETLVRMVHAGLDGVRINFSHGSLEEHTAFAALARATEARTGRPLPIMQDLQGTKVRIGELTGGRTEFNADDIVQITGTPTMGTRDLMSVDDPMLIEKVEVGTRLLLGDGDVCMEVVAHDGDTIQCRVESGSFVRQGAGITAPAVPLPGGLTDKDRVDIKTGVELDVDLVALSFVHTKADVLEARARFGELGHRPFILAKIERVGALEHLEGILETADGILVARGDLGIALPPEKVPVAQKLMLKSAAHHGSLSITATQMLESMTKHARPTRAETSDVANAILDGTQAVMLSGETAIGHDPVNAVDMMSRVILETEAAVAAGDLHVPIHRAHSEGNPSDAIALACAVTAEEIDAKAILAFTMSGKTALRVAKYRPRIPIIGATPSLSVCRQLNLVWGVTPMLVPESNSMRKITKMAEETAKKHALLEPGDTYVLTGGDLGVAGSTNLMRVGTVA